MEGSGLVRIMGGGGGGGGPFIIYGRGCAGICIGILSKCFPKEEQNTSDKN